MTQRKVNIYDKIATLIPSYKGYSERDSRRNIDKQLRCQIAADLLLTEKKIEQHNLLLIKQNHIKIAMEWELVRKAINTLIPKIKHAAYGVSSFFADEQIKENELEKIYDMDYALAERIQLIVKTVNEHISEPIMNTSILQSLAAIDNLMNERTNFIDQYK
jgi:hypothetical protein